MKTKVKLILLVVLILLTIGLLELTVGHSNTMAAVIGGLAGTVAATITSVALCLVLFRRQVRF